MHLPGPVRAAVGLIAIVADEARNLPDRAFELPMLAVSTALQASLRAQQRYARLEARGDEALARHRTGDEPPAWATFDDPVPADVPAESPRPVAPAKRAVAGAKTAAAKDATAKRVAAVKQAGSPAPGKGVSLPRHTAPSRFDTVETTDTGADATGAPGTDPTG